MFRFTENIAVRGILAINFFYFPQDARLFGRVVDAGVEKGLNIYEIAAGYILLTLHETPAELGNVDQVVNLEQRRLQIQSLYQRMGKASATIEAGIKRLYARHRLRVWRPIDWNEWQAEFRTICGQLEPRYAPWSSNGDSDLLFVNWTPIEKCWLKGMSPDISALVFLQKHHPNGLWRGNWANREEHVSEQSTWASGRYRQANAKSFNYFARKAFIVAVISFVLLALSRAIARTIGVNM